MCLACLLVFEWGVCKTAQKIILHCVQVTQMDVSPCFYPNPRSTFITTADRIRSLPISEYMWLREWILSWQEDGGGIFRRLMGERMWPVILGCPEDIHHNTSDGGCMHDMYFPSGEQGPW